MISQLGGDARGFRRERKRGIKNLISEAYSPPRVTKMLEKLPSQEIAPGFALDLTTADEHGEPWDFSKGRMREKAKSLLEGTKPMTLVGSPVCNELCTWPAARPIHSVGRKDQ